MVLLVLNSSLLYPGEENHHCDIMLCHQKKCFIINGVDNEIWQPQRDLIANISPINPLSEQIEPPVRGIISDEGQTLYRLCIATFSLLKN